MAPLAAFSWSWFLVGLLLGSWIGATIGSACVLLLAGRRMKKLETVNQLLRVKLRAHMLRPRAAAHRALAPVLRPFRVVTETAAIPIDRIASGN
ncbi:MAG TPA: hypothetical protein VFE06_17555 [Acidobacteriaceae bacterium]|jgi:hypothetical protein|nr:hypothetical protein [Acidobacteriaceae bacterium]